MIVNRLLRFTWFPYAALVAGLIFLYGPIVYLIVYSFNASQLVTVWSGFSTHWYGALLQDDEMLRAAGLSLEVGLVSATFALMIGTIAGFVLARFQRFKGRTLFSALVSAPLVMPEIIMGISMLLLFVGMQQAIGWPVGRGVNTIIIAHITFSLSFVAVVIQSRLADMDISIEEAAMDLGAKPVQVFFLVTLPLMTPALISGWLLALSLSLDDVVITSFTSGPGSTTLPLVVFSRVRLGLNPEINALAALVILVVSMATLIAFALRMRNEKAAA